MHTLVDLEPMEALPILALRGMTIFPGMLLHFDVSREGSIKALDESMSSGRPIFLVTQRDLAVEEPGLADLYTVGTLSQVKQILRLPGDNVRVMIEGATRGRLQALTQSTPFLAGQIQLLHTGAYRKNNPKTEALVRSIYELLESYIELSPQLTADVLLQIMASQDPGYIADYIAQNIPMRAGDKQTILEELRPVRRLEKLAQILDLELETLRLEQDMALKLRGRLAENQKDYYLREQLKTIRAELGEADEADEAQEYREKIKAAGLPAPVEEKLNREVARLAGQPYGSAETAVIRNYLDVCLELPWTKTTKTRIDLAAAHRILERDHYGLTQVKERILEFLAVMRLAPEAPGQIICLVGPPGVGKTSVAASVARATGRTLARVSLGGIHDEAEIRGHRKTYVGAMPGRIIEALRQAGSKNPLLLLDEIDKLASDIHGDPSSALLEVLDGEQNSSFRDHFVELPFDLSQVLFITTANTTETIPRPLLDRMEVIQLTSYTDEEKLQIAKRHLLPKQLRRHGLDRSHLRIGDGAIRALIAGYTRESGVRQLERQLAALCRKRARKLVEGDKTRITIREPDLAAWLGPRKYHPEHRDRLPQVGVANGLAWTSAGGELLQVEVNVVPGTGKLQLTGNLGDVMKESAQAALTYLRSRAQVLGLEEDFYKTKDVHVHFPEGAVPKDGPSAGITIATATVSAFTGRPVRQDLAMTGEITLRGRVLPIGGLKEKTMAALRNGITTVLIPAENLPDLEKIDPTVRAALRILPVEDVDQVLGHALAWKTQAEDRPDWSRDLTSRGGDLGRSLTQ